MSKVYDIYRAVYKTIQSQWYSAVELAKEVENDEIRYYIIPR